MAALPPLPSRLDVIRAHRQQGGQVAAVLPVYAPRALLRAHGLLPVEIWGPPGVPFAGGASHLQPYVCSIVRNALSFLEGGGLDAVDMVLVPHACDSLQGLGSILLDFVKPRQPVLPLYLPRNDGAGAARFLVEELRRLAGGLRAVSGRTPTPEEMLALVVAEEATDRLLGELYSSRRALPLSNSEFYRLVRAREYLPNELFEKAARQALALRQETPAAGTLLFLSGVVPEPTGFMQALDERGVQIVGDDLLCGRRRICPQGRSLDPIERIAEGWLSGPPDSTRGSPIEARRDALLHGVRSSGARGVVFYLVKFCEPELFYLPSCARRSSTTGSPRSCWK